MRTLALLLLPLAFCGCTKQAGIALAPSLDEPGTTRTVLSRHETDAVFTGIETQPCRHLTAECPDKCDHGGVYARFTITAYRAYAKTGDYGDPRQTEFLAPLRSRAGAPRTDSVTLAKIEALSPGDPVRLDWRHEYVTRDGSSWPERPLTRVERRAK